MIACITPNDDFIEETDSTLQYASKATNIMNIPMKNEDPRTR